MALQRRKEREKRKRALRVMTIDPACGSGGFLISGLDPVWKSVEKEGKEKEWTAAYIQTVKTEVANKCFRGIDKDSFLAKVTKAYMAIVGDGRGGVFCENSLVDPNDLAKVLKEFFMSLRRTF